MLPAEESYNANGIVPRALSLIKSKFPQAMVCTDVALDPYSSQAIHFLPFLSLFLPFLSLCSFPFSLVIMSSTMSGS